MAILGKGVSFELRDHLLCIEIDTSQDFGLSGSGKSNITIVKGDMKELMELVVAGKIDPVAVETRDVSKANETLQEMKEGKLLGLVALTHD